MPSEGDLGRFLTDDSVAVFDDPMMSTPTTKWAATRIGLAEPFARFTGTRPGQGLWSGLTSAGDRFHGGDGRVYDMRTGQQLRPPTGRKFHSGLAGFALDERFVIADLNGVDVVIDVRTDKYFPVLTKQGIADWRNLSGFGIVYITAGHEELRLVPSPARLHIPPDLLELWAQVAVCGEIGSDGSFAKWDELTWEKKRQELAAKPAPYPDFPFPGHVANDRLHWLRKEYDSASDADKPRLATQLLDRAEAAGDKAEAARWRAKAKQP